MAQRGIFLLMVTLVAAAVAAAVAVANRADPTATVTGSPEASPDASPGASPEASPLALVGDVERGRTAAAQCLGCHSVDGSILVGPSWLGLYGSTETLADGTTVVVDEAYLYESITDPNAKIVEGFQPNLMPSYAFLDEQQIADIIAYIKSLAE